MRTGHKASDPSLRPSRLEASASKVSEPWLEANLPGLTRAEGPYPKVVRVVLEHLAVAKRHDGLVRKNLSVSLHLETAQWRGGRQRLRNALAAKGLPACWNTSGH